MDIFGPDDLTYI